MYVIYHNSTKRGFKYDQKRKQFQQINVHGCELTTRNLLCQETIFNRTTGTTCSDIQRQPLSYLDEKME